MEENNRIKKELIELKELINSSLIRAALIFAELIFAEFVQIRKKLFLKTQHAFLGQQDEAKDAGKSLKNME